MKTNQVTLNLNFSIYVKLTEKGWRHYKKCRDEHLQPAARQTLAKHKAEASADGYVGIIFWRFLQWFGGENSALGVATDYYDLDVRLDTEYLISK